MDEKKKIVSFSLDQKFLQDLQSYAEKEGVSVSDIVRRALQNYLNKEEALEKIVSASDDLSEQAALLASVVDRLVSVLRQQNLQLTNLVSLTQDLKEVLEVVCFWTALIVELFKVRILQTKLFGLSEEEFEVFKRVWELSHERADKRVESLLGRRVWKHIFDPTKDPLKEIVEELKKEDKE